MSPLCGATPAGVKSRTRGVVPVRFDFTGENPDGLAEPQPTIPPGWAQVAEDQALARGLQACLRCRQ